MSTSLKIRHISDSSYDHFFHFFEISSLFVNFRQWNRSDVPKIPEKNLKFESIFSNMTNSVRKNAISAVWVSSLGRKEVIWTVNHPSHGLKLGPTGNLVCFERLEIYLLCYNQDMVYPNNKCIQYKQYTYLLMKFKTCLSTWTWPNRWLCFFQSSKWTRLKIDSKDPL